MRQNVAHILGGALLIALVAAGTPFAQTLRVARTLATSEKNAETRLLLPGEWSGSKLTQNDQNKSENGKESPVAPQLLKPVSEQWDIGRAFQAPVADLPAAMELPVCVASSEPVNSDKIIWLPQTGPPDIRLRGPPVYS